jgi:site-specific recombinase XerD
MSHAINTVTARAKLKLKREPYWHPIKKGFALGYRKMSTDGAGSWVVRTLNLETSKKTYKTLGDFADLPDHQRFDAAMAEAAKLMEHIAKGGSTAPKTIQDVCENYASHIRQTKTETAAVDVERRFKGYVLDDVRLAKLEVSKLTPAHIDTWRKRLTARPVKQGMRGIKRKEEGYALDRLAKLRTPSTLNRDMTPFRAALNLAFEEGWVTTDFAWRGKLKPLENADIKRELYLDKAQRTKFIGCADPDVALFLRGMATLPVRPGALAKLKVGNFDKRLMALRIKVDKNNTRTIKLPPAAAELFLEAAKDKLPTAPLFTRSDGTAWNKDFWKNPVKSAALAANLPDGATAYTMRHSVITDLVHGGLDLLTVAQISGTSVRMIEKHYGHLRGDVAANALAMLAL